MKFVTQDYYQILNVSPEANGEEVKRAYRTVRQSFRPDSMAVHSLYSPEQTEAISAKIDEAFQILSQPEQASSYRRYRRNGRSGMGIPRSPEVFFDEVHELDTPSSIEALAAAVGTSESSPALDEDTMDHEDIESELDDLAESDGQTAAEAEEPSELFLSCLEEMEQPPPATTTRPLAPRRSAATSQTWTPAPPPQRSSQPSAPGAGSSSDSRLTSPGLRPVAPHSMSGSSQSSAARELSDEAVANPFARPTNNPSTIHQQEFQALPTEELEAIEVDTQGINGMYLRKVREALGMDLFYIAAQTKIGRSMLGFIETDNANELPAKVYLKGYLQHIARLLKLPEAHTTERYLSNLESN